MADETTLSELADRVAAIEVRAENTDTLLEGFKDIATLLIKETEEAKKNPTHYGKAASQCR